jgi:hypothetical protein
MLYYDEDEDEEKTYDKAAITGSASARAERTGRMLDAPLPYRKQAKTIIKGKANGCVFSLDSDNLKCPYQILVSILA